MCLHVVYACIDRSNLEREVAELRAQLSASSVLSEAGELKRALDRKEKERLQLSLQVEVCEALVCINQQELVTENQFHVIPSLAVLPVRSNE